MSTTSSSKWADYAISAVRFKKRTDGSKYISELRVKEDNGDAFGTASLVSKEIVIANIKRGTSYVTIMWNYETGNWKQGQKVHYYKHSDGQEYLRTVKDNTHTNNLDNLLNWDWI